MADIFVNSGGSIQAAVNAASPGDTIIVAAGTYVEQVIVSSKANLTIRAADGADVTIKAPGDVVFSATDLAGYDINAVLSVLESSGFTLQNINIDGAGAGNTVDDIPGGQPADFVGVFVRASSATLTDVDVTGVRDAYEPGTTVGGNPVISGTQRGQGILVDNATVLDFTMTGGSVKDFQKTGILVYSADVNITGVAVTGGGAQTIIGQNGIQIFGSTGAIDGNTITGIGYAGPQDDVYSGAVIAFGNTDLDITDNVITGANNETTVARVIGVYVIDFGGTPNSGAITGNTISFVDEGIDVTGVINPDGITIEDNAVTNVDATDQYAYGLYFNVDADSNQAFDIEGTGTKDEFLGGDSGDTFDGLAGSDTFLGRGGDDTFNGGADSDTAVFSGSRSDYTVTTSTDANGNRVITVKDNNVDSNSGDEGTDTLTGVETLNFADSNLDADGRVQLFDEDGDLVGTFDTIQGAVDAAGSVIGAVTIVAADGNYAESVIIDRGDLTLLSENGRGATTITGVAGAALGAIEIDPGVNNVRIGDAGQGFTIIGLNGNGAIENAAIYLQGAHNGIAIEGNDVRANGDLGLLSEFGQALTNSVIEGNIFSGQTFVGAQPGGSGFGEQFNVGNNVPRALAVISTGDNVTFTNNQVTGTAGGISSATNAPFGNTLVTIDSANSEISGNSFTGFTDGSGYALRARGAGTDITGNTLDDSGPGQSRGILVNNQGVPGDYSGNAYTGSDGVDRVFSLTPGNDNVMLGGSDDAVIAGGGNDTIDGGSGTDTAAYSGVRSGYSIVETRDASGRVTGFSSVTDTDTANGDEGTDSLTSIEALSFAGGTTLNAAQKVQLFDANDNLVGTFDTIQAAENAASDNFTIRLAAGEYDEDVTIDVGVTILGAQAGTSATGRNPASAVGASNILGSVTVNAVQGVTIDGVRVVNDVAGGNSVSFLSGGGVEGNVIRNSVIYSTVQGGNQGDFAIFTATLATGSLTIDDNYVSGAFTGQFATASFQSGLFFNGGGQALTVSDNIFEFTRSGLNLDMNGASTANVTNNLFRNVGSAIAVGVDADGLTVSNNDLQNAGTDFSFRNLAGAVTFDAGAAVDMLTPVNNPNDLIVVLGGSGGDTLTGTEFADFIDGNNSPTAPGALDADTLNGAAGNDQIFGRGGDDKVTGGAGNDALDGGANSDTAFFSGARAGYTVTRSTAINGVETVTVTDINASDGNDGVDTLVNFEFLNFDGQVFNAAQVETRSGSGNQTFNGGGGDEIVFSGSGNDTANGGGGDDDLYGESGNDTLNGGEGNDELFGGGGTDTMDGGNGDDDLDGGTGNDRMTGAGGDDDFVFQAGNGADTITDFTVGSDQIVLEGGITIRSIVYKNVGGGAAQDAVVTFGAGGGSVTLLDVGNLGPNGEALIRAENDNPDGPSPTMPPAASFAPAQSLQFSSALAMNEFLL